jgi:hypothetical protein
MKEQKRRGEGAVPAKPPAVTWAHAAGEAALP